MTQQKITVISGNNVLRGYSENGVYTLADGLKEYFYIVCNLFPSNLVTFSYYLANNIPFKLKNIFVKTDGSGTDRKLKIYTDSNPIAVEVPLPSNQINIVASTEGIITPVKSTLFVYNDNVNILDLRFVCQRVALVDSIHPVGKAIS